MHESYLTLKMIEFTNFYRNFKFERANYKPYSQQFSFNLYMRNREESFHLKIELSI